MNKFIIFVCITLTACSGPYEDNIDKAYVKDCNEKGGKVERIEYSSTLQCVGVTK